MSQRLLSRLAAIILATLSFSFTNASMFNSQPQFTIKAEKYNAFGKSCLIGETFKIEGGKIADCLEHCLENCRCQSFQICQNTECQLCSSNKEENSSLLHENNDCVYAMYEMRHLAETFQKLDDQCSGMSCYMKYNCCQQSGLCPENKTCKPMNSLAKPWKRFTCECPGGYHGDNCKPIKSCQGYVNINGSQKSGKYKIVASHGSVYEVYCHFDADGAWTLVQSYSFANRTQFQKPLTEDTPISEDALTWSGYRLRKARMQSINVNSDHLRFTCDYAEKEHEVSNSDYLQMSLKVLGSNKDITSNDPHTYMSTFDGKIYEKNLAGCRIKLHQDGKGLHVHIDHEGDCVFQPTKPHGCGPFHYFSYFPNAACVGMQTHRCTQNVDSTSQLWFGKGQRPA